MRALAAVLLLASTVQAQAINRSLPTRIAGYVRTHRELLASDALIVAALGADAASSTHCQSVGARFQPNPCSEQNPLLGHHPSTPAMWTFAMGYASAVVASDHLLWHITRDGPDRITEHLVWLTSIPISVVESVNVHDNVNVTEGLQNARRRLGP